MANSGDRRRYSGRREEGAMRDYRGAPDAWVTETRKVYWWAVFPVFSLVPLPLYVLFKDLSGELLWLVAGVVVFINMGTGLLYYYDKLCAETRSWRIGERKLHLAALLGGWPGAFVAQQLLRHKVAKPSFQFTFWGTVLLYQLLSIDALQGFLFLRAVSFSQ